MYRIVFRFHKWESVKTFICGLGRLDFKHICALARLKLLKSLFSTDNSVLLCIFKIYAHHHGMSRRHDESPSVALAVAEKSDAGFAYAPVDVTCV